MLLRDAAFVRVILWTVCGPGLIRGVWDGTGVIFGSSMCYIHAVGIVGPRQREAQMPLARGQSAEAEPSQRESPERDFAQFTVYI